MPKVAERVRAERRAQILAAARVCFAECGYYATTMADIAARAGVSKGTPYLYFPSKQALFVALHEQWDCAVTKRVQTAVAALSESERTSPRSVLRAVAEAVAEHVLVEPEACRVLMEVRAFAAHEPEIAAAVAAADGRLQGQLEGLFAAGVRAGQWPQETDPALAARLFSATVYGLMAQWHVAPASFSWPEAISALTGEGRGFGEAASA